MNASFIASPLCKVSVLGVPCIRVRVSRRSKTNSETETHAASDGHRAELWALDKPIATCSLTTARRGNELFVDFFAERPKKNAPEGALEKYRFAQAQVAVDLENPSHSIEHWVIPVVDSSR